MIYLVLKPYPLHFFFSSTKIRIKGPQIGSDMPSALGLVPCYLGMEINAETQLTGAMIVVVDN